MKDVLFKSVNTLLIGGGALNSYNIIKYVNISNFS